MSPPELAVYVPKLAQQLVRRTTLYELHHATRRQVRREAQQKMHVIRPNVTLEDHDVVGLADLPHQISNPNPYWPFQDRLAVLRNEHEVQMDLVDRVRSLPILRHRPNSTASLLKGFA